MKKILVSAWGITLLQEVKTKNLPLVQYYLTREIKSCSCVSAKDILIDYDLN